ncbi:putative RDD family membrane protein YckC [Pseudonocardia eucalypti]|uniref:RDD family protein n=1 Tax=Pseudonocardia eucalypti TaxID=648755 RepID=UPI00160B5F29|nr:putative RDD family membrane protein YckC [Pseudonocardia eucalypti]
MSDLVTGEAVVLELRPAKLPSRAVAFGIDLLVMCPVVVALLLVALPGIEGDPAMAAAVGLAVYVGVFVGYPVTMETLTRGRTLGKMAMGLRVVREDGGPIRFRQALARGLGGLIVDFGVASGSTGVIGVLTSLLSERGRRVGDMLAGTLVVRERQGMPEQAELVMPAPLADWAKALQLAGLPDALALRVRQFLGRAGQLDPGRRHALAHDLASQVAAVVSPPPPGDTPPEAYLTAVLVVRRDRALSGPVPAVPEQRRAPAGEESGGFVLPH